MVKTFGTTPPGDALATKFPEPVILPVNLAAESGSLKHSVAPAPMSISAAAHNEISELSTITVAPGETVFCSADVINGIAAHAATDIPRNRLRIC
jgi:hypothetical protein